MILEIQNNNNDMDTKSPKTTKTTTTEEEPNIHTPMTIKGRILYIEMKDYQREIKKRLQKYKKRD